MPEKKPWEQYADDKEAEREKAKKPSPPKASAGDKASAFISGLFGGGETSSDAPELYARKKKINAEFAKAGGQKPAQ